MKKFVDINNIEQYRLAKHKFNEQYKSLSDKIARQKEICDQAQKKIIALQEELNNLKYPSVYESVVVPLAEELAKHFNTEFDIYGPFGLMGEIIIVLMKDTMKSISEQPTISLTLRISDDVVLYDTGKRINRYSKGSIGELNGMNKVFKPLPMDFDEIVKLCVKSEEVDKQ